MGKKVDWVLYIPDDGHWMVRGKHSNYRSARKAAVKMLKPINGLKRLPNGSKLNRWENVE